MKSLVYGLITHFKAILQYFIYLLVLDIITHIYTRIIGKSRTLSALIIGVSLFIVLFDVQTEVYEKKMDIVKSTS